MKILVGILVISTFLLGGSCARRSQDANVTGTWTGDITEKGESTLVGLSLREQPGIIEGEFKILSETGEDVDKGMTFDIVGAERSGNKLTFIVPIGGEVDDDAIEFELRVEGNRLKGQAHELREGSEPLPITLTRQELIPTAPPGRRL
jgi:hypothetical protein